jgi:hypothetical protein
VPFEQFHHAGHLIRRTDYERKARAHVNAPSFPETWHPPQKAARAVVFQHPASLCLSPDTHFGASQIRPSIVLPAQGISMSLCTALARIFTGARFSDAMRQPFLGKAALSSPDEHIVQRWESRLAHSSLGRLGKLRIDAIYHLLGNRVPYGSQKRDIERKLADLQASLGNPDGRKEKNQARPAHPRFSMFAKNRPHFPDAGSTKKNFVIPLACSGQEVVRSERETMLHILLTQKDAATLNIREDSSPVLSSTPQPQPQHKTEPANAGTAQRLGDQAYEPPCVVDDLYTVFNSSSIDMAAMIDRLGIQGNASASHVQKTISTERNLCWMRSSVVSIVRQYAMQPDGRRRLEDRLRGILDARPRTHYLNERAAKRETDILCLGGMVDAASVNLGLGGSGVDPILVDGGPDAGMLRDPSAADQSTGIANGEGTGLRLMMALLDEPGEHLPKIGDFQDESVVTRLHRLLGADSVIQNIYMTSNRTKAEATVFPENCSIYMSSQRQGSHLKEYIDQAMQEKAFSGHATLSPAALSASKFSDIARQEDMTMLVNYGGHFRVFVLKRAST